jgi:hypothetical protein
MATITLTFPLDTYPSLQVGDITYYVNPTVTNGVYVWNDTSNFGTDLIQIGAVTAIATSSAAFTVTCDIPNSVALPTTSSFIFFAKDNAVNCSSLAGYYGSAKFVNDSIERAEMFAASCEINESSK